MATLNLNIHKVVCVDEIGGEWEEKFGNDEIYLGGVTINGSNIGKVDPFEVYADFDDGDVKDYAPPRVFYSFDLSNNATWPINVGALFVLADKQVDGFSGHEQAVNNIHQAISISPNVGAIMDQLELMGLNIIKKIRLADKVFAPRIVTETININHSWNGSGQSPVASVRFDGFKGIYELFYNWSIL